MNAVHSHVMQCILVLPHSVDLLLLTFFTERGFLMVEMKNIMLESAITASLPHLRL